MQEFLSNTPVQIRIDLAKKRGIIKICISSLCSRATNWEFIGFAELTIDS